MLHLSLLLYFIVNFWLFIHLCITYCFPCNTEASARAFARCLNSYCSAGNPGCFRELARKHDEISCSEWSWPELSVREQQRLWLATQSVSLVYNQTAHVCVELCLRSLRHRAGFESNTRATGQTSSQLSHLQLLQRPTWIRPIDETKVLIDGYSNTNTTSQVPATFHVCRREIPRRVRSWV